MKEEFTKSDLKDGMVVEQVNKIRYLFLGNRLLRIGFHDALKYYSDKLEHTIFEEGTIKKVFIVKNDNVNCLEEIFWDTNLELIWERSEVKHMTVDEMQRKLEELTGEKIETEPSREEMIGSIDLYCHSECCSSCAIYSECSGCSTDIVNMPNEKLKECYEKVIKDGNKTEKM